MRSDICKKCADKSCYGYDRSITECEYFQPMTNADRIRAMTDEELAKYLAWTEDEQACYQWEMYGDANKISEWLDWLKSPASKESEG